MGTLLLIKGFVIGFSISAAVGPLSILCMQRTLVRGRLVGSVSFLGIAMADALYGCIAGFGLTFISTPLLAHQQALRIIGGLCLCYIAVTILRTKMTENTQPVSEIDLLHNFLSGFFLAFTSPITIFFFLAVFASVGLDGAAGSYLKATLFVLSVFIGSAAWGLFLTQVTWFFRSHLRKGVLQIINTISAILIGGFGLYAILF